MEMDVIEDEGRSAVFIVIREVTCLGSVEVHRISMLKRNTIIMKACDLGTSLFDMLDYPTMHMKL